MHIKKLSPPLINQIAAGEVIEGPSSVLREVLENSLDAGATQIDICLRGAGYGLIQVRDNGKGIPKEQLPLALERHATSKMAAEDLFAIETFGFRGEALASIASVSHLTLTSRTAEQELAFCITQENTTPQPTGGAIGTTVCVKNLFCHTPARLKFSRSERAERLSMRRILWCYALSYPHVRFMVTEEESNFWRAEACLDQTVAQNNQEHTTSFIEKKGLSTRINHLFPNIPTSQWLQVKSAKDDYTLCGVVAPATYHFSNRALQYFFVNDRPLKDKLLQRILQVAFRDVMMHGRFGACVLFLTVPPVKIDQNVHPAKEEVRFAEPKFLERWLIHTLQNLLHRPLTEKIASENLSTKIAAFTPPQNNVGDARENCSADNNYHKNMPQTAALVCETPTTYHTENTQRKEIAHPTLAQTNTETLADDALKPLKTKEHSQDNTPSFENFVHPLGQPLGQIHNSYIVAHNDDGLVIVDQHAAHERLGYEDLKAQPLSFDTPASESFTIPSLLKLSKAHFDALYPHLGILRKKGFHIEPQGSTTFVVYSSPALLKKYPLTQILSDLAAHLLKVATRHHQKTNETEENETVLSFLQNLFYEALGNKACKASIKAGKKLSIDEMNALLRAIETTKRAGNCNHGRPTYLTLSRQDLDKMFDRKK